MTHVHHHSHGSFLNASAYAPVALVNPNTILEIRCQNQMGCPCGWPGCVSDITFPTPSIGLEQSRYISAIEATELVQEINSALRWTTKVKVKEIIQRWNTGVFSGRKCHLAMPGSHENPRYSGTLSLVSDEPLPHAGVTASSSVPVGYAVGTGALPTSASPSSAPYSILPTSMSTPYTVLPPSSGGVEMQSTQTLVAPVYVIGAPSSNHNGAYSGRM
eukprot:gene24572-29688_t